MEFKEEDIRLILGLKVKRARQALGLSLAELGTRTGLSVSYLNEIEKGRKYPKAERIAALAKALGTTFDKLVSLRLDKHLAPVGELLGSGVLKDLPLDLFGIDKGKLVEIIANAPAKVAAFISTLSRIAANYDLTQEHFYFAALRSYLELNGNHFEELEAEVVRFRAEHGLGDAEHLDSDRLRNLLVDRFGYVVEAIDLSGRPELAHIRSTFIPASGKLLVNARLAEEQKAFLYAKELGYAFLGLSGQRALTTPWPRAAGFEHVLNNSRASYFGGALLTPALDLCDALRAFFALRRFDGAALLAIMARYNAAPEMFMMRLTNLVPHHFGITKFFFQRFDQDGATVTLRKELHLDRQQEPQAIELLNDGVGLWLKEAVFPMVPADRAVCAAHRFTGTDGTQHLVIAMARASSHAPTQRLAVCIGMARVPANAKFIAFMDDPGLGSSPLVQRTVMARREQEFRRLQAAMEGLLSEHGG